MTDVQVKLTEFSDLITRYTADFVGREWLVEQVDALLDDPDCCFVVLTGGPGVGKTAFLAHLAATHSQWLRYFIRRDSRDLLRPSPRHRRAGQAGGHGGNLPRYPGCGPLVAVRAWITEALKGMKALNVVCSQPRVLTFHVLR